MKLATEENLWTTITWVTGFSLASLVFLQFTAAPAQLPRDSLTKQVLIMAAGIAMMGFPLGALGYEWFKSQSRDKIIFFVDAETGVVVHKERVPEREVEG
jgi:hypothetical protein